MPDLSIIIVNYRGWTALSQCLDPLIDMGREHFSLEVVVVDNDSNDGLIVPFREKYPSVRFIQNQSNRGFSNGCNLGAIQSRGETLLFLNPDTVVNVKALTAMLHEVHSRPLNSLVSCQQLTSSGQKSRPFGRFLTPYTLTGWSRAVNRIFGGSALNHFPQTTDFIYPDWVSGSVIMMSRQTFEALGGWDDDFWMYFEDVDLCRRARILGGEIVLMKKVSIEHAHGGTTRVNAQTAILTKAEVNISRHVYIDKYESGFKGAFMHTFLVLNHLVLGIFPALLGALLFFVKRYAIFSGVYLRLVGYYALALRERSWLSPRSVAYLLRQEIQAN